MITSFEPGQERVAQVVRETICSILPNLRAEEIAGSLSLANHGADSVDRVEILLSIMNRLGIDEPLSNFSGIPNINELVNYLCRAQRR